MHEGGRTLESDPAPAEIGRPAPSTEALVAPAPDHAGAETAGAHIVRRVPTAAGDTTVADAVARLTGHVYDAVDAIHVVSEAGRLEGVVPLGTLFGSPPDRTLRDLMTHPPVEVLSNCDQEQVALLAVRHGLTSVPVVGNDDTLLGVVPAPALLDILRREHVEDVHRLAGIQRETARARDALEVAPERRARDRLPWLVVGLAGSMVAALVVARFERLLAERIAVAFFVPAIVYLADAIGTQTEAIVVRGLSVSHQPLRRLLGSELRTGLIMGLVLATLSVPAVALGTEDLRLALAVALAIVVAGGFATTIGLLLPWLLSRHGRDPALGSGPLATIVQDILSLLVYFATVSLLFR